MENKVIGDVTINLTSKGYYTWKITVPLLGTDKRSERTVTEIKKIDNLLKDEFPRHAGFNKVSVKKFKNSW